MRNSLNRMVFFLIPVAVLVTGNALHDYHVGIHHISYNDDTQTFQISHKVFADDLESSLRLTGSQARLGDNLETEEIRLALTSYFDAHFTLTADAKKLPTAYVGAKWEDYHSLYIFRETEVVKKPAAMELMNDLFMEVNDDQQHMHYFKISGIEQSAPTMKGKESMTLSFPSPSNK